MASGVHTMPEYMRKRFGGQRIRVTLAVLTIMLYIFTKISVGEGGHLLFCKTVNLKSSSFQADLYAGALFISGSLSDIGGGSKVWIKYLYMCFLLVLCGIFTIFGGFTSVIWTDILQTTLMITGAGIVSICGK